MTQPSADDEDPLYLAAVLVEQDDELNAEIAEWEAGTLGDGLEDIDEEPWPPAPPDE